jgi:hypothetical protein
VLLQAPVDPCGERAVDRIATLFGGIIAQSQIKSPLSPILARVVRNNLFD